MVSKNGVCFCVLVSSLLSVVGCGGEDPSPITDATTKSLEAGSLDSVSESARKERERGDFCVLNPAEHGSLRCYPSDQEAATHASAGALRLNADGTEPDDRTMRAMIEQPAAASAKKLDRTFIMAIFYSTSFYRGAKLYFTNRNRNYCRDGNEAKYPDLGLQGFDNRMSSLKLYNECGVTLYQFKHFEGDAAYKVHDAPILPFWDNRPSSLIVW